MVEAYQQRLLAALQALKPASTPTLTNTIVTPPPPSSLLQYPSMVSDIVPSQITHPASFRSSKVPLSTSTWMIFLTAVLLVGISLGIAISILVYHRKSRQSNK